MKNSSRNSLLCCMVLGALLGLCAGCHHPKEAFPEAHPEAWTPTEVETLLGGDDPLEPWNRAMFSCTDFLMNYVADPLGRVYCSIFPRPFIEHFHNVCVNLEFPARAVSCLLRAEWRGAGDETLRFLINSTLGIVGIFDVAQKWFYLPSTEADFGSTFAHWGIGPGESFMLPVAPALNGRDLLGLLFDSAFDIKTYIPYAGYATFLNRMVMAHSAYDTVAGGALDPYKNFRQMLLLRRELQQQLWFYRKINQQIMMYKLSAASAGKGAVKKEPVVIRRPRPDGVKANYVELKNYHPQDPVSDTLRVMMFQPQTDYDKWYMPLSVFDSSFSGRRRIYDLELSPGRPAARYGFYPAPEKRKKIIGKREELVLLLPGIGGTLDGGTMVALAEIFHKRGAHVAVCDSTFNWRFIIADSRCKLPGYLPDDAERVRKLLLASLEDIFSRGLVPPDAAVTVAGYSLGGLHTLKIADLESRDPRINPERFIAINPPVSVRHALARIDELANATRNWSKSKLLSVLNDSAGNAFMMFARRYAHYDGAGPNTVYKVDLHESAARVIVGLYLRLCLRDVLLVAHRERNLPELPEYRSSRRHQLYREIDRVSLEKYARVYLAPEYPGRQLEDLMKESSLQHFEASLRNNPAIRVFHNYDDFLLNDAERRWLDSTFGSRLTWFSHGGHLGNLYYRNVSGAVGDLLTH